jgi:hypothetical protein
MNLRQIVDEAEKQALELVPPVMSEAGGLNYGFN